jgi:hypothetical protein
VIHAHMGASTTVRVPAPFPSPRSLICIHIQPYTSTFAFTLHLPTLLVPATRNLDQASQHHVLRAGACSATRRPRLRSTAARARARRRAHGHGRSAYLLNSSYLRERVGFRHRNTVHGPRAATPLARSMTADTANDRGHPHTAVHAVRRMSAILLQPAHLGPPSRHAIRSQPVVSLPGHAVAIGILTPRTAACASSATLADALDGLHDTC